MSPVRIRGLISLAPPLSPELDKDVTNAVEAVLHIDAAPPSQFRTAPDLTFEVQLADKKWKTFELVSAGTAIRDPESRGVWPFPPGKRMLAELAPARRRRER
jgi:hypothetical protein